MSDKEKEAASKAKLPKKSAAKKKGAEVAAPEVAQEAPQSVQTQPAVTTEKEKDMTQAAEGSTGKGKRAPVEYTVVTMDDGRKVEFAGKRKMLKDSILNEDGSIQVRLDFVNGETRLFTLPTTLVGRFAAHGAEQKLGDEIAGVTDVEDCILAVDELMERLNAGEWGATRAAGNGIAGTSILARALIEHSGKPADVIKAFLRDKTQAQKLALRNNPQIQPIIARLEAAKVRKEKDSINTEEMLAGL